MIVDSWFATRNDKEYLIIFAKPPKISYNSLT